MPHGTVESSFRHVPPDRTLASRIAVVTGAGRGIGRGAAFGLARRHARIVVVDVTTDELDTTVAMVQAEGAEVMPLRADLTDRNQIDGMLDTVAKTWGPIDILVNNAAVLHTKSFEDTTPQVWTETIQVVLEAPYYLSWRVCGDMLKRGRGNIVTVSSTAGVKPFALETAYCAAKYGVEGLFRSMALEVTSRGLIVTLCTPGKTTKQTSMTDAAFAALPAEQQERYVSPLAFAEAFGYLAAITDPASSGRRFDLFALAELVREHGWTVPAWLALQRAERNTP